MRFNGVTREVCVEFEEGKCGIYDAELIYNLGTIDFTFHKEVCSIFFAIFNI